MVTSNMEACKINTGMRGNYMTDDIYDSLSLCGCRFILRFRRESKLKSLLLHTNSKTSGVGWEGVRWGGEGRGGVVFGVK